MFYAIARYNSVSCYAEEFFPWHLPGNQLTHILYSGCHLVNGKLALNDLYADIDRYYVEHGDDWNNPQKAIRGNVGQINKMKVQNPTLKVFISMDCDELISNEVDEEIFFISLSELMILYNFDGFDLLIKAQNSSEFVSRITKYAKSHNITLCLSLSTKFIGIVDFASYDILNVTDALNFIDTNIPPFAVSGVDLSDYNLSHYTHPNRTSISFQGISHHNIELVKQLLVSFENTKQEIEQPTSDLIGEILSHLVRSTNYIVKPQEINKNVLIDIKGLHCTCPCSTCKFFNGHQILIWAVGVLYVENCIVIYNAEQYLNLKKHVSKQAWTPDFAKTLWVKI